MWAQNSLWAYMGIFCKWANEIKAQKFVPQQTAWAKLVIFVWRPSCDTIYIIVKTTPRHT